MSIRPAAMLAVLVRPAAMLVWSVVRPEVLVWSAVRLRALVCPVVVAAICVRSALLLAVPGTPAVALPAMTRPAQVGDTSGRMRWTRMPGWESARAIGGSRTCTSSAKPAACVTPCRYAAEGPAISVPGGSRIRAARQASAWSRSNRASA
ncbi:hypothetical protein ABZ783_18875 [Micromonospora sp. NPDC047738]|uniref:hypothetical protein n=1 Tax=Micromonospora sp. NPDC047738 TaxID=3155741 RepID=UPI0034058814